MAGQFMFSSILLALRDRDRTGRGQAIDISLFDSILATMALPAGIFFATGQKPPRMGNQHPSISPYETFRAKDGLVMVCAGNPKLWRQFCEAIERPDLPADSRFAGNLGRLQHRARPRRHRRSAESPAGRSTSSSRGSSAAAFPAGG